ncbi:hypothetical protein EDC04DRAFT_2740208, partial [Pisolithus marmoratus]
EQDYEWFVRYFSTVLHLHSSVRHDDGCIPSGLEHIPSNMYISGRPDETYMGFSGYRLIAGDRCDKSRGLCMDEPEFESCSQAKRPGFILTFFFFRLAKLNLPKCQLRPRP